VQASLRPGEDHLPVSQDDGSGVWDSGLPLAQLIEWGLRWTGLQLLHVHFRATGEFGWEWWAGQAGAIPGQARRGMDQG
jgi:hypothetical protein